MGNSFPTQVLGLYQVLCAVWGASACGLKNKLEFGAFMTHVMCNCAYFCVVFMAYYTMTKMLKIHMVTHKALLQRDALDKLRFSFPDLLSL
jgi:hypothetical protein